MRQWLNALLSLLISLTLTMTNPLYKQPFMRMTVSAAET